MIVLRDSGNGRGSSLSTAFIREYGAHLIRKHSNLQMYDSVRFDVLCDSIHSLLLHLGSIFSLECQKPRTLTFSRGWAQIADLLTQALPKGAVGVVVAEFVEPEEAYEVEFCNEQGETVVQVALLPTEITRLIDGANRRPGNQKI